MTKKPTYEELEQRVDALEKEARERKRLDERLRLLSLTIEQSSEGIAVVDLNGNIEYLNDAFANMHGYSSEELVGKHISIFHMPDQMPSVEAANRQIEETGSYKGEIWHVRRDGTVFPTLMHNSMLRDEAGNPIGMIGTLRDITALKLAEEETKASEVRYRELFRNISSGVAIYEAEDNGKDFIFKDLNRTGERIDNIKKEDLIGKSVLDVFPGVKEFGLFDVLKRVWETGKPEDHPLSLYKDERIMGWRENYVYKLPSGEIVAVYDDITERKQEEELLKRSEEKFAKAFQHGPSLMTISSIEDGKYIEVNENFVRITGYSREASIGATSVDLGFLSEEDRDELKQELIKNGRVNGMELTLRKKDGDTLYCLYFGEIITVDGEQRLLSIASDITDRKHAEERIEHINLVLRAIRNVNQLITKEKDRDKLLQGACKNLVETRGYYNAWIALFDESGKLLKTAEAGLGDDFLPMLERLKRGELTDSGRTALSQTDIVITEDPSSTCLDCPLAEKYSGRGALTVRLGHAGKVYGLLSVSIDRDLTAYKEEQELFIEVTEDIAYALYNIEQEDKRKRVQAALRESEEKYRSLVETITDLVFVLAPNGSFTFLNPEFEKLIGFPAQDFIGRHFTEILAPEYIESTVDRFKRGLSGETIPIYEVALTHKDGNKVSVELKVTSLLDADGNTIGRIGLARDITERKRTEEELKQSEKRLNTILDSIQTGIVIINAETHEIIDANPAAIKMIGSPEGEIIGHVCHKYICPAEKGACPITDLGQKIDNSERILLTANGKEVPILKTVTPVLLGGKQCLLDSFIDISEKKTLEAQLQQAQKMESIGTLAGGIAHDFNNILSPIMIHSEMAMMELPPESPVQNSLKQIFQAGERAGGLTKQILTFSRMRQQERSPFKVGLIVKECLKMLRASLPTTIEINQNLEAESDTVLCDITEINQVLMNLCTNAAHAMRDKGGELTINLTEEHLDPEAAGKFSDLNPGSYLKLTVSDTGHGIDNETMKNIFEPYYTTKATGEGTGMGLAVVHGIVRSYGGDITVESEPGKGTVFHVLLPTIESEASPPIEPAAKLPKGTERILFVDDEKIAVDAVQAMLERLGYKVTARTSSIEALEAFRNNPQGFDLVITDMTMPNMTGDALAKELMSIRSDIPIILCTGFSEKIDEKKALHMGIRAFLMKPIVMGQIANTIREVLGDRGIDDWGLGSGY